MPQRVSTTSRIAALRSLMESNNIQAYLVPSEDAHNSEYIADCDKRREFISGFAGSYGSALVTTTQALLWTDGRYYTQANEEMDENWTLMKQGLPTTPSQENWISENLPSNSKIGVDPTLMTINLAKTFEKVLQTKNQKIEYIQQNLVDKIWPDRPTSPSKGLIILKEDISGVNVQTKLKVLQDSINSSKALGIVISSLDEIAWLLNLRGQDIEFNPLFFSYFMNYGSVNTLYVNQSKLSDEITQHLATSNVKIRPYDAIIEDCIKFPRPSQDSGDKFLVSKTCNMAIVNALSGMNVDHVLSPICTAKAIKNPVEIQGIKNAHIRDATSLCEFFGWLEDQIESGKEISEVGAADKLYEMRKINEKFMGLSFETISAYESNGAIVHYKPEVQNQKVIGKDSLYLCDSGAQYLDGTTDVTRTLHFGTPTEHQKLCFTRVLQGHIALDLAKFPQGTTGYQLDPIARLPLWSMGLNYRHGTGHGVGAFLGVHEGPHGIGTRVVLNEVSLKSGMTVTNEPGYYEEGNFGIRIENVMIIKEAKLAHNFGDVGYLEFEYVTLVPIQQKMIKKDILSEAEIQWINTYHKKCLDILTPLMKADSVGCKWLIKETKPISK